MGFSPKKPERKHQGGMQFAAKSPGDRRKDPSYVDTDDEEEIEDGLTASRSKAVEGNNGKNQPKDYPDKGRTRSRSRSKVKIKPNPKKTVKEGGNSAAKRLQEIRDCDEKIQRQIENLKRMRKVLYSSTKFTHTETDGGDAEDNINQGKPRIISNVQIVPPKVNLGKVSNETPNQNEGTWATIVRKRDSRKQNKGQQEAQPAGNTKKPVLGNNGKTSKKEGKIKRRPPRTAAVAIENTSTDQTDAEIIRKARMNISLGEMGIENPRIRKAANGSILVEVSGPEKIDKANTLANKLKEVLQNDAKISKPSIKGELRIIGVDESITTEEIACAVADAGRCTMSDVDVGQIRPMTNGFGIAWAQCPLQAACRSAGKDSLKVGWTTVKVELLKARPMQCYKCWEYGHLAVNCKAARNLIGACYRCGLPGHNARGCLEKPRCVICAEKGIDDQQRLGSSTCTIKPEATNSKGRKVALLAGRAKQMEPARRAEEMEIN